MAAPFVEGPVPGRSLFKRLLRRPTSDAARVEVGNVLARAVSVRDVTAGDLAQIEDRYGVDLQLSLPTVLQTLFKKYLDYCLTDHHMSDDEVADLVHLKTLFDLTDTDARRFHDEAAGGGYRDALGERLTDGSLTPEEQAFLDTLATRLLLSEEYAQRLRGEVSQDVFKRAELMATSDVRLSPEEDGELDALAASLGIGRGQLGSNPALLERLRLYWAIENGDLPVAEVSVHLPRGERAHLALPGVEWNEYRTTTRQVGFQRRSNMLATKTATGLALAFALGEDTEAIELQTVTSEELAPVDTGILYLTNRRLILDGPRVNKSIGLSEILSFGLISDGLSIEQAEGRPIILRIPAQIDTVSLLLTRLIREANAEPPADTGSTPAGSEA